MHLQRGLAQRANVLLQELNSLSIGPRPELPDDSTQAKRLTDLSRQVREIREKNGQMQANILDLQGRKANGVPPRLTWRARQFLLTGKELLHKLSLLDELVNITGARSDRIGEYYEQTVAFADMSLRSLQALPGEADLQLNYCRGIEVALNDVNQRIDNLQKSLNARQETMERVAALGQLLHGLANNRPVMWKSFETLAEKIIEEAREGISLEFVGFEGNQAELWAAAHSLNTAQVVARVIHCDSQWAGDMVRPVLAALVYDAGMATVPLEILTSPDALQDEQKQQIEAHAGHSAESLRAIVPQEGWLVDAVRTHHERMDGTGYPAGLKGAQIPRLSRLLAVCDVYTALRSPRAFRRAKSSRSALTETLLQAEQGLLDVQCAELLLELSFYPVGTTVELDDGRLGIVAAVNRSRELNAPARPVIQLIDECEDSPLTGPRFVDLAQSAGRHIVRSVEE